MSGWKKTHYPLWGSPGKGCLSVMEDMPFTPQRVFWIWGWPDGVKRGGHAHRTCHQIFVVIQGGVTFILKGEEMEEEIVISDPFNGLYVPPMTWLEMEAHKPLRTNIFSGGSLNTFLFCVCSESYDEKEYIRDYEEFQNLLKKGGT